MTESVAPVSDCCGSSGPNGREPSRKDLVVVGGGSAAFAAAIKMSELGGETVIINDGLPIGGTCVNVGCIPSKTMVRAADAVWRAQHNHFDGLSTSGTVSDFGHIVAQTQSLVEDMRFEKYVNVVADDPAIQIVSGKARIQDRHCVEADGQRFAADNILIATGARTFVPDIPGLAAVPFLTNDSIYNLDELPSHLIILGGRYIALENAQIFSRLGSSVTIIQRSDSIIPDQDEDVSEEITGFLKAEGVTILTGSDILNVEEAETGVVVTVEEGGEQKQIQGSHLMLATGRRGNTDDLGLEALGIQLHGSGYVQVDETQRTSVSHIFAAGDVIGEQQFVYTAAYEGSLAAENAFRSMHKSRDYSVLPWVIFTDPQVAGVGLDEKQAAETGIDIEVSKLEMKHVPRAIAARDTRGFIKLLRNPVTDELLGARIVAPEGAELLMELSLAIKHQITVTELKEAFHPYLTLSEAIKLASISFGKDVGKLSCCAV